MGPLLKAGVIVSLSVISFAQQSLAGQQDDQYEALLGKLKNCKRLPSENERVRCYDALVPADDAVVMSEPAPVAAAISAPKARTSIPTDKITVKPLPAAAPQAAPKVSDKPAVSDKRDAFGADQLSRPKEEKVEKKASKYKVSKVTQNRNKLYYFYMENGQVWRQLERQRLYVPKGRAFDVEIIQGSFGDYRMRIEGKGRQTRVKRIK